MPDASDMELLREYDREGSETAFAELVQRQVDLVYSTALRHVGVVAQAEEITQAVFVILARKGGRWRGDTVLEGWLYETTRLTALRFMRGERRRQFREQEAYMQSTFPESTVDPAWDRLAPLLDEGMAELGKKDRDAVMLRYFKGKSVREVAGALNASEAAAQKRLLRAVGKLRHFFTKRGVTVSAGVLTTAITANSIQAAPATVAKMATAIAVAKGATASTSTLTLIKGALKTMAWAKAKMALVLATGILLAGGTTTLVVAKMNSAPAKPAASLDSYLQDPELNGLESAPPMVAIQLTHFADSNLQPGRLLGRTAGEKEIGRNTQLSTAILKAYNYANLGRTVMPEEVIQLRVDYLVSVPDHPKEQFQAEIKRVFGWTAHEETRETDVFLLRVHHQGAPGLTKADDSSWEAWTAKHPGRRGVRRHNITVPKFCELMEGLTQKPIIDETGLTGNYDFIVGSFGPDEIQQAFVDQLGLELVPARKSVKMLVVEKTK